MREILFRRCRLEIEPSGVVRIWKDGHLSADMHPPQEHERLAQVHAATFGYDSPRRCHIDHIVAEAWLWDIFDRDWALEEDVAALLLDDPLPTAGTWDEMSRFWFRRVRDGWPLVEHGHVLNASTWTSFLASAIKADHDAITNTPAD